MTAVDREIAVQSQDNARGELFAHPYQAGVGQRYLHRIVALHESAHGGSLFLNAERDRHKPALEEVDDRPRPAGDLPQEKAGFGENGVAG